MDIYLRKRRWKWILFGIAVLIVSFSLYYTNILVEEIRKDERKKVQVWADAISRKADLVNFSNKLFEQIKNEERKRVVKMAEVYRLIEQAPLNSDITFLASFTEENTTIPVIMTDQTRKIINFRNIDINLDSMPVLEGKLLKEFTKYEPIVAFRSGKTTYLMYYKDSNIFSELKVVLDDLIHSFFTEIVLNSASVPVIITDSLQKEVIDYGNIPEASMKDSVWVAATLHSMASHNTPIRVNVAETGTRYIFYQDSSLQIQLKYYPYFQLGVIAVFLLISYLLFSYARKSEQNQVWVGMAKETAHQLGTPLSSMVAWVELLKIKGIDAETLKEIGKDVQRLETITDRFSKIGSAARLETTNIVQVIHNVVSYMRFRLSPKVSFEIRPVLPAEILVPVNMHLFEWVIENLCKNAVDAMEGSGVISIDISEDSGHVSIDVSDTGKGIPKSRFRTIFNPGYTSKQRGWGLGLTLSKRIIENYHSGKIFVKSSAINKGTTFRILLKK